MSEGLSFEGIDHEVTFAFIALNPGASVGQNNALLLAWSPLVGMFCFEIACVGLCARA